MGGETGEKGTEGRYRGKGKARERDRVETKVANRDKGKDKVI